MSDQSNGEGDASSSKHADRGRKSPKAKPAKINISRPIGSGRRRQSFRRVLAGRPLQVPRTTSSDSIDPIITNSDESDDEGRGRRRSNLHDSPLSPQASSPRSLRHHRIDSLMTPTRELSPARSVRWADENGSRPVSGVGTPTKVLSPLSPSTPLPGSEAPSETEGGDSPQSQRQVSFDVPENGPDHSHLHYSHSHGERA